MFIILSYLKFSPTLVVPYKRLEFRYFDVLFLYQETFLGRRVFKKLKAKIKPIAPMYTSKQCSHTTDYDSKPEDNQDSTSITCITGYPSKSRERGEGRREANLRHHREQGYRYRYTWVLNRWWIFTLMYYNQKTKT